MSTPRFKVGDPVWVYWRDHPREAATITEGGVLTPFDIGVSGIIRKPGYGYTVDIWRDNLVAEEVLRHRYDGTGKSLDQFMTEIKKPRVRMPHEQF